MFGFGKNKSSDKPGDKKDKKQNKQQAIVAANISDDKFVVMPQQYRTGEGKKPKGPRKGINTKFLILGGVGLVILIALSAILYFVLFAPSTSTAPTTVPPVVVPPVTTTPTAPVDQNTEDDSSTQEKIVSTQAFDENNILVGTLEMTIPATVVQSFGSGVGITVLNESDLSLPDEGLLLGGIYSVYPGGITFDEPVSFEIIAINVPESLSKANIYPAYLRGIKWQEFEDYQASFAGFTLTLDKFTSGPIAIIWKEDDSQAGAGEITLTQVPASTDTDSDGLTDAEEQLLGTSNTSADSDEDTYMDLDEITNGYSPLSGEGATLDSAGLFGVYTNETYGYKAAYPVSWLADSLDQTNKQVLFISDTEEFFEILIEENPLNTPIVDWYRGQSPSLANIELNVAILDGRPGVWSPDGLTLYTSKDGLIYILTYNRGTREEVSWPNLFEHFYNSFIFGNTSSSDQSSGETGTTTGEVATTTGETL